MRHEHLLLLYPPGWRARYGQEFLATLEDGSLTVREVIDIVFGAFDAWLSTDVRRMSVPRLAPDEGGSMMLESWLTCEREAAAVTPRDGLIGAAVILIGSLTFKILARASTTVLPTASHVLMDLAFVGPFTLSMPFWLMKGQPSKAQTLIVGVTLAILVFIG
ncbi:MAG TPA: hypothetical protein VH583_18215 [Vicinamibacterales bacterium]|jgi:hypothetical protein